MACEVPRVVLGCVVASTGVMCPLAAMVLHVG